VLTPSIVDEDVHRSEAIDGRVDQVVALRRLGRIRVDKHATQTLGGGVPGLLVQVSHHDLHGLCGEVLGDGPADPARRSGYDGDTRCHGSSPPSCDCEGLTIDAAKLAPEAQARL
jgi:hypothetical protein